MKTFVSVIAIALCSFATTSASAQNNNPGLQDENKRIHQGVTSGELTVAETKRLEFEKSQLKAEAYNYKHNDGHIGKWEKADLRRDNRRFSRDIYCQKHDRQRRF